MFNLTKFIFFLILSLLLLGSCSNGNQNTQSNNIIEIPDNNTDTIPASQINISIKNFLFNPEIFTIKVGTKITWINEDTVHHTATSEGFFDSGELNKGDSFSFTFNEIGTYDYICTYHPNMKGKIIVEN